MDVSDFEQNGSLHEEDMDYSHIEETSSSNSEDMDLSDSDDSGASSAPSSVTEYLRFTGPAHRQNWSFPDTIIFYMAKNPSTPKLYQNLIRTCKYFFLINPIIICSDLELRCRKMDEDSEEKVSRSDAETNHESAAVKVTDDYWRIEQYFIKKNGFYKTAYKKIDLKNFSAKIWIVDSDDPGDSYFEMHDSVTNKNIVSSIIPKIYRCNVKNLKLYHQNLSFAEFSFLAISSIEIGLDKVTIKYDDGTVVPVEKIVECARKATRFDIELDDNDGSISSETVKNLLEIPHFTNIKNIFLDNIPDSFDIETFSVYLIKHKLESTELYFSLSISDAYKNRLEAITDEIEEAGGHGGYKSPTILHPGVNFERIRMKCKYCISF